MEVQAYLCPQCGAPLTVDENTTFTTCKNCGCNIKITHSDNKSNPAEEKKMKQFVSKEGVVLGTAYIPDNYEIGGNYEESWRSELVPLFYAFKARRDDYKILMQAYSKELFHEIKNPFLKGMIKISDAHVKSGYDKFIEPEDYLIKEANRIAGIKLNLVGIAKLPSPLAKNPDAAKKILNNDISLYGTFVEIEPEVVSIYNDSLLYRFTGKMDGNDVVVLMGMDYEGAELAYTKPVFSGLVSKIKDKKNKEVRFGHSNKHVDHIMFGPQRSYFAMCYADYENEMQQAFFNFINTIIPDDGLKEREQQLLVNKFEVMARQVARNQQVIQQNLRNLQYNQQRLRQTLQENANAMSDMIMDSWNQKMASDSRLSQARSEATMGVNTYTNSYGQNVEVSVVADHVYENQYGDVYGVSGSALDQDVLNQINWKEIKK